MALKLSREINAVNHEYWVVEGHSDKHNKRTDIMMLLYTSEDTRKNKGQTPVYREKFPLSMEGTGISDADKYAFVKQSILKQEITEEDGKSVINEVETNPFANAVDII